jgi:hypothetical protein
MTQITTCQICARAIKAGKGTIAHHGYKRPGRGWQTASCIGTGYAPYEVARNRIPYAIQLAEQFKTQREARLAELTTNPPATLKVQFNRGAWSKPEYQDVERPADFNPADPKLDYKPRSYRSQWSSEVYSAQRDIRDVTADIVMLQKRYDDWKGNDHVA